VSIAPGGEGDRLPYINLEDERLDGMEAGHLTSLVETCYRQHSALRGRETVTWFFDEIHVVPGGERFVRRLIDSQKCGCSSPAPPHPCFRVRSLPRFVAVHGES
jgi:predicted AAA+ superfamily ATPase